MTRTKAVAGILVVGLALGTQAMAHGSIEGNVAFTGKAPAPVKLKREADPFCAKKPMMDESVTVKDGKLANVYVRIVKGAAKGAAPAGDVMVDQIDCMYRPRIQGAVTGQKLVVKNSDKTLHNVHTYVGKKTVFNRAMPPVATMPPIEYAMSESGNTTIRFQCDVHPWMKGYVHLTDHPFFAVSGEDGSFKIANVPAGTYTVEAIHEKFGPKTVEVKVEEGKPAKAEFAYAGTEKAPPEK